MGGNRTPSKSNRKSDGARSVSDLLGNVMEPAMKRRSGMTVALLQAWDELAGETFREVTKPERIEWPRRINESDPFEPGTLVVACEPVSALFFQHDQAAVLERVNLFFGFTAIKRIKILQKPVAAVEKQASRRGEDLDAEQEKRLQQMVRDIDNRTLKETMMKLGRGVISQSG